MNGIFRTLTVFAITQISLCMAGADALTPVELGKVKVGGEIGRRIDATIYNNLLKLDVEKDFIAPFRWSKRRSRPRSRTATSAGWPLRCECGAYGTFTRWATSSSA